MAVWMIFVGGTGRDAQAHPHYQRGEDVRRRFDRVGDERVGVPDDSGKKLDDDETRVREEASLRPANAPPYRVSHCGIGLLEVDFLQPRGGSVDASGVRFGVLARLATRNHKLRILRRA